MVLEDQDEANEIVTQFHDERTRVVQTFVKECKRRLTLSCRGMVSECVKLVSNHSMNACAHINFCSPTAYHSPETLVWFFCLHAVVRADNREL